MIFRECRMMRVCVGLVIVIRKGGRKEDQAG